jgi:hypothetical protein
MMVFIVRECVDTVPGKQAAILVYPKGIAGKRMVVSSGRCVFNTSIAVFAESREVSRSVPMGK